MIEPHYPCHLQQMYLALGDVGPFWLCTLDHWFDRLWHLIYSGIAFVTRSAPSDAGAPNAFMSNLVIHTRLHFTSLYLLPWILNHHHRVNRNPSYRQKFHSLSISWFGSLLIGLTCRYRPKRALDIENQVNVPHPSQKLEKKMSYVQFKL